MGRVANYFVIGYLESINQFIVIAEIQIKKQIDKILFAYTMQINYSTREREKERKGRIFLYFEN